MAKKYQSFPGMEDILPSEVQKWQWVERKAVLFFSAVGCEEIRTPILEPTELFTRSIGETSDIVHKEMYTFEDRGNRSMTMRPEMTASVARAVTQHALLRGGKPLSLYYTGPMFRAERPQAGRKRQFHQIGVELIQYADRSVADFLVMDYLFRFLDALKLTHTFRLNDLSGLNGEDGDKVRSKIRDYFSEHKSELDEDSLYRLDRNVLRIFDSKNPKMQDLLENFPWDEICPVSDDFRTLIEKLKKGGVPVETNRRLVRGLDYYTGIVFEVTAEGLGAQDAIAGGGRYDKLYHELGGPEVPCTGFSIGFERLLTALSKNTPALDEQMRKDKIYVAPIASDHEAISKKCSELSLSLGQLGFSVKSGASSEKLGGSLKQADKWGAKKAVLLGEDEYQNKTWLVKDMASGDQQKVAFGELIQYLKGSDLP